MTQKEKARDLYGKFLVTVHPRECPEVLARHCAIECVEEIIKVIAVNHLPNKDYWETVKKELQNI